MWVCFSLHSLTDHFLSLSLSYKRKSFFGNPMPSFFFTSLYSHSLLLFAMSLFTSQDSHIIITLSASNYVAIFVLLIKNTEQWMKLLSNVCVYISCLQWYDTLIVPCTVPFYLLLYTCYYPIPQYAFPNSNHDSICLGYIYSSCVWTPK